MKLTQFAQWATLFLFLSTMGQKHATEAKKLSDNSTDISGEWENELGSTVYFEQEDNRLDGKYKSSVGNTDGGYYPLFGGCIPKEKLYSFSVVWSKESAPGNSIATMNCRLSDEKLLCDWVLRRSGSSWNTTLVGRNVFSRKLP